MLHDETLQHINVKHVVVFLFQFPLINEGRISDVGQTLQESDDQKIAKNLNEDVFRLDFFTSLAIFGFGENGVEISNESLKSKKDTKVHNKSCTSRVLISSNQFFLHDIISGKEKENIHANYWEAPICNSVTRSKMQTSNIVFFKCPEVK